MDRETESEFYAQRAHDVLDLAKAARRQLTDKDWLEIKADLVKSIDLRMGDDEEAKRFKAEGEAELRRQMIEMGKGLEMGQTKAQVLGPWAKAFREKVFGGPDAFGQKQSIPPSGAAMLPALGTLVEPVGDRVKSLLQLFPKVEQVGSNTYDYLQETARTHAAAPVEPGAKKPASTYTLERNTDTMRTIAHIANPAKKQDVADFGLLGKYLDGALREGLILAIEDEIINGDGTGQHFTGFLSTTGVWAVAYNTSILLTTRDALTVLESVPVWPTAWVLSPTDWAELEMTVTSTGGSFVMQVPGNVPPVDRAARRLWGLPVALSVMMPVGQALLGDWSFANFLEMEGVRVEWSESVYDSGAGATDFERNLVRFRCEGRFGFYVGRPAAFAVVDLTSGS